MPDGALRETTSAITDEAPVHSMMMSGASSAYQPPRSLTSCGLIPSSTRSNTCTSRCC